MANRVVVEVEGRHASRAGLDPKVLDSEQREEEEQQVRELNGQEERAKRKPWRHMLSRESETEVA